MSMKDERQYFYSGIAIVPGTMRIHQGKGVEHIEEETAYFYGIWPASKNETFIEIIKSIVDYESRVREGAKVTLSSFNKMEA